MNIIYYFRRCSYYFKKCILILYILNTLEISNFQNNNHWKLLLGKNLLEICEFVIDVWDKFPHPSKTLWIIVDKYKWLGIVVKYTQGQKRPQLYSPNLFIERGIDASLNEEQNEKQWTPNSVTNDGIFICVKDEHPEKAWDPIEVTEEGIVICVNDEQSEKALFLIEVTEEGIVICRNNEHPRNELWLIIVKEEGIVIWVNDEQP